MNERLSRKGDIHVLVVGDPGLGKSEMLKAVHKLAPRGIYVCGTTTSSSGLTVTLVRDANSGEFGLEVSQWQARWGAPFGWCWPVYEQRCLNDPPRSPPWKHPSVDFVDLIALICWSRQFTVSFLFACWRVCCAGWCVGARGPRCGLH